MVAITQALHIVQSSEFDELATWRPHSGLSIGLAVSPKEICTLQLRKPKKVEVSDCGPAALAQAWESVTRSWKSQPLLPEPALIIPHIAMEGVVDQARGAGQAFLDWARQLELSFRKLFPHQRSRGRGQMPQLVVLPLPEAVERKRGSEFADSALAAWHGICARLADLQAVLKRIRSSGQEQEHQKPADPSKWLAHAHSLRKAVINFADKLGPEVRKQTPEQNQILQRCRDLEDVGVADLEAVLQGSRKACTATAAKVDREINKSIQHWIESDEKNGLGQVHAWAKNKVDPCVTEHVDTKGLITRPLDVVKKKIRAWATMWLSDDGPQRVKRALAEVSSAADTEEPLPLAPLSVEKLDAALSATRDRCGLGVDWIEPRLLKEAPVQAKKQLVSQMGQWGNQVWCRPSWCTTWSSPS